MKRWLIRSFFIGLLLLCVAVWVRSYTIGQVISYKHGSQSMEFGIAKGMLTIDWLGEGFAKEGFRCVTMDSSELISVIKLMTVHSCLGFAVGYGKAGYSTYTLLGIPFWFSTSALALFSIYAFYKTRPKPNPATAFPVETDNLKS